MGPVLELLLCLPLVLAVQDNVAEHCGASVGADPQELQLATSSVATQQDEEDKADEAVLHDQDDGCAEWAASGECTDKCWYNCCTHDEHTGA
jgi:hypothetical protein